MSFFQTTTAFCKNSHCTNNTHFIGKLQNIFALECGLIHSGDPLELAIPSTGNPGYTTDDLKNMISESLLHANHVSLFVCNEQDIFFPRRDQNI